MDEQQPHQVHWMVKILIIIMIVVFTLVVLYIIACIFTTHQFGCADCGRRFGSHRRRCYRKRHTWGQWFKSFFHKSQEIQPHNDSQPSQNSQLEVNKVKVISTTTTAVQ